MPAVFQVCAGFSSGDAISNEALIIERYLKEKEVETAIFAEQFPESASTIVQHFRRLPDRRDQTLIYHHSFHSGAFPFVARTRARHKILIFHNVTPPEYVEPYSKRLAVHLALARTELAGHAETFQDVLADSHFNSFDLKRLGFRKVNVMPVIMDFDALDEIKDTLKPQWFMENGINIIFVGRIFPNKRHQDIIKTFYYFKKLCPRSRLILIGPFHPGVRGYMGELANLAAELNLKNDVIFTGMIPQRELNRCYEYADLFFSMSEHEGFFVPLIECMYKRVPILAYASSVIPETLGRSGVTFYKKDFGLIAEMMLELIENESFRKGVLDSQTKRVSDFSMQKTLPLLEQALLED